MLIFGDIGSGKSSIIQALLYSIATKKLDSGTLVNTINKKNMLVKAAWHVDSMKDPMVIHRGMKPAKFEIEGVEQSLQAEMKKTLSEKIHITDPQVLLNLCALSISKSLPFFELKKQDRLDFLRNFVDTSRLDELADEARAINIATNKDVISHTSTLEVLRKQLIDIERKLDDVPPPPDVKTLSDEELHELHDLIKEAEAEQESIREALMSERNVSDTEQKARDELAAIKEDFEKALQLKRTMEGERSNLNRSIRETESDMKRISDDASECVEYFIDLINNYKERLGAIKQDMVQVDAALDAMKHNMEELEQTIQAEINKHDDEKLRLRKKLDEIQEKLQVLKEVQNTDRAAREAKARYDAQIDALSDLKSLRSNLKKQINDATNELAEAERLFLVSKEYRKILDNTWSYMANQMVPFLNSRLPHYMQELELDFYMQFDPTDISKPYFRGRAGVGDLKLSDLSTGQKGMTSIALAHSLRDLEAATQGKEVSFLILDEISANISHDRVEHLMNFETRYAKQHGLSLIHI